MNEKSFPMIAGLVALVLVVLLVISMSGKPVKQPVSVPVVRNEPAVISAPTPNGAVSQSVSVPLPLKQEVKIKN